MLKNKKAIYILIPVNLFIWSFFAYRIYSAFNEGDEPVTSFTASSVKITELKDSTYYKLSMDYKDPFLKSSRKEHKADLKKDIPTARPNKDVAVIKPVPVAIPKQLPDVKYVGLIKNTSSGFTGALVSVNGRSKLIKQNETFDGIIFKSFNKDSLVAKWGKERIVVKK